MRQDPSADVIDRLSHALGVELTRRPGAPPQRDKSDPKQWKPGETPPSKQVGGAATPNTREDVRLMTTSPLNRTPTVSEILAGPETRRFIERRDELLEEQRRLRAALRTSNPGKVSALGTFPPEAIARIRRRGVA